MHTQVCVLCVHVCVRVYGFVYLVVWVRLFAHVCDFVCGCVYVVVCGYVRLFVVVWHVYVCVYMSVSV